MSQRGQPRPGLDHEISPMYGLLSSHGSWPHKENPAKALKVTLQEGEMDRA